MSYDIAVLEDCASNYGVFDAPASKGTREVVMEGSEIGPRCDCDGFKYRRDCSHAKWVYANACLYNRQWHDGNKDPIAKPKEYTYTQFGPGTCPVCGGPTVLVRRAV